MNEREWLSTDDVGRMLQYLQAMNTVIGVGDSLYPVPHTSDRKFRLFAVACCRQVWQLHPDDRSRRAVEVAERYADGEATEEERQHYRIIPDFTCAGMAASLCCEPTGGQAALGSQHYLQESFPFAVQADLFRDVVGNPFRPVSLDPGWQTPTVLALAQASYDERGRKCLACNEWTDCQWCGNTRRIIEDSHLDPARLAVLSDALEDAGCLSHGCIHCGFGAYINMNPPCGCYLADILLHLRWKGLHVRGCWALDLLLGK